MDAFFADDSIDLISVLAFELVGVVTRHWFEYIVADEVLDSLLLGLVRLV